LTDEQQAAVIFDEIMQWGGVAPPRKPGDFTVSEFAAHIQRSEATARRTLMALTESGQLATERRYDPVMCRTRPVWWVTQMGGTAIEPATAAVGAWGSGVGE